MDSALRYVDESGRDVSSTSAYIHMPPTNDNHVWYDKYVDDLNAGEPLARDGKCGKYVQTDAKQDLNA